MVCDSGGGGEAASKVAASESHLLLFSPVNSLKWRLDLLAPLLTNGFLQRGRNPASEIRVGGMSLLWGALSLTLGLPALGEAGCHVVRQLSLEKCNGHLRRAPTL